MTQHAPTILQKTGNWRLMPRSRLFEPNVFSPLGVLGASLDIRYFTYHKANIPGRKARAQVSAQVALICNSRQAVNRGCQMIGSTDIVLLCRNTIVREGLRRILSSEDFNVVLSTHEIAELTALDVVLQKAIVLIDSSSEEAETEALSIVRKRYPSCYPVILADHFNYQAMVAALRNGARGYIVKEICCEPLVSTLQLVALGEKVLPSQLADELQLRPASVAQSGEGAVTATNLSDRELEILEWLVMGCPNKVISRHMEISEATVKVHVKAVLRKLSVKNRTQAAIWAANHGLRARDMDDAGDFEANYFAAQPVTDLSRAVPAIA
ncbi:response regulator transcription factor [Novosphingobium sp. RD2P27]|uniref:Response regulator transcription factor n=1 Tax=Novosphingobium kalidii TaxID=3230299 RepID=A0ABV2D4C1_9SPHN